MVETTAMAEVIHVPVSRSWFMTTSSNPKKKTSQDWPQLHSTQHNGEYSPRKNCPVDQQSSGPGGSNTTSTDASTTCLAWHRRSKNRHPWVNRDERQNLGDSTSCHVSDKVRTALIHWQLATNQNHKSVSQSVLLPIQNVSVCE